MNNISEHHEKQPQKRKGPLFSISLVGYGIHILLCSLLGVYSDYCAKIVQTAMENPNFDFSNEYESWESVTYFLAFLEMILYSYFPLILFAIVMLCLAIARRRLRYGRYFIKFTGIWLGLTSMVIFLFMYLNLMDMQRAYSV